jgi:hypothetical protein
VSFMALSFDKLYSQTHHRSTTGRTTCLIFVSTGIGDGDLIVAVPGCYDSESLERLRLELHTPTKCRLETSNCRFMEPLAHCVAQQDTGQLDHGATAGRLSGSLGVREVAPPEVRSTNLCDS